MKTKWSQNDNSDVFKLCFFILKIALLPLYYLGLMLLWGLGLRASEDKQDELDV